VTHYYLLTSHAGTASKWLHFNHPTVKTSSYARRSRFFAINIVAKLQWYRPWHWQSM